MRSHSVVPLAIGVLLTVGPLGTSLARGSELPISAAYLALHVAPALLLFAAALWHGRWWNWMAFVALALSVGAGPFVAPLLGVGPEIVTSVHAAAYHYLPAAVLLDAARRRSRHVHTAAPTLSTDLTRAQ